VVEGPIGVGKSTLAQMLAAKLNARAVMEQADENPFMHDFYRNPDKFAFQTQVFFLLARWRQQEELQQTDLFHTNTVSDYLFDKDRIFARLTLTANEFSLYEQIHDHLVGDVVKPDLVVYLYASVDRLIRRVNKRAKTYEAAMKPEYLEQVVRAYNDYFFNYRETPLLMVNTEQIDFVENTGDFMELFRKIESIKGGVHHFTPLSHLPLPKVPKPAGEE
jgi:deoxyadenosine/deoxycytidine kinase